MSTSGPSATTSGVRGGFTLLEVVLALAIAIVVLYGVNMGVSVVLRAVDDARRHAEHAQLARALLQIVADDLRGVVFTPQRDIESLLPALPRGALGALGGSSGQSRSGGSGGSSGGGSGSNSGSGSGGSLGGTSGGASGGGSSSGRSGGSSGRSGSGGTGSGSTGSGSTSGLGMSSTGDGDLPAAEGESTESESQSDSGSVPAVAGLYGSQYELQIDISRLPRLESSWQTDPDGIAHPASAEIRSVNYYLAGGAAAAPGATTSNAAFASSASVGALSGLVRRELNRASALYAATAGTAIDAARYDRVLAPEVVLLEFRYFDGTTWLTQWDSSTQGGLPVAVEIVLGLVRPGSLTAEGSSSGAGIALEAEDIRFYRRVVYLPNAALRDPVSGSPASQESSGESSEAAP
jgi:type II secretory pathway pseudopilin PulG